ncbi:MAG: hypothetical protein MK297_00435 [Planctomycetes bacterium]|nr:hypothetical protein [Planctomycetota bacterium]
MVEKNRDMQALSIQWGALGGHAAVAAGAFAAFVSLLRGVSLSTACIRGIVSVLVLRAIFYFVKTMLELFERPQEEADAAGR